MKFELTAISLGDHRRVDLGQMISLDCSKSLTTPVTTLTATIRCDVFPPDLGDITLSSGGDPLFEGKVDRQKTVMSEDGILLSVEARSKGRLLLDNEAMPCTLWGANLSTIFLRHVGNFGFSLVSNFSGGTLPLFPVGKGMSHWDVFAEFCQSLHHVRPFVRGEQVHCQQMTSGDPLLLFSNGTPTGTPYTKVTHQRSPYEMVSKIFLRDEQGQYSASVSNSLARYYEVERERYMIPQTELTSRGGVDANQRIRASISRSEEYLLEVPSFVEVDLADTIELEHPFLGKKLLVVDGVKHSFHDQGMNTRLTLKDPQYA